MDLDFDFALPSPEELQERLERETAVALMWSSANLELPERIAARDETSKPSRINLLSLPAWLEIAKAAGIAAIPARPLGELPINDFFAAFDHTDRDGVEDPFATFHNKVVEQLGEHEMIRMEQVAPREIKGELSAGRPMSNGLIDLADGSGLYLDLIEDRFYTTFRDLGADRVRAYARPIVSPQMVDGVFHEGPGRWPVEFRVYVEDGEVVGISNYYPQVSLEFDEVRLAMRASVAMARNMIDTLASKRLGVGNHHLAPDLDETAAQVQRPDWMPANWGPQSYTLDFMLLDTGSVVFLEGGPAGLVSAHPCCFLQDDRDIEPDFLHGIALSTHDPILPLSALDRD